MRDFDLIIIGSGPAGLEVEHMLGDPEKRVCILDKSPSKYGGVCVNTGCMPTKHLAKCAEIIEISKKAKEFSLNIPEIDVNLSDITDGKMHLTSMLSGFHQSTTNSEIMFGEAKFISNKVLDVTKSDGEKEQITAENIVIATGSRPATLPFIEVDGHYICNSDQLLDNREIPNSMLIIGGGVIGLEFASIYRSYGSEVTIVEAAPVLLPNEDIDTGMMTKELLEKRGIQVFTNHKITSAIINESKVDCTFEGTSLESQTYDKVLVCVGRLPNTDNIGLENTDITLTKGFIDVNDSLEVSVSGIYAAGDIISTLMLAHTAVYEAMVITANLNAPGSMSNRNQIAPRVIFSNPEIAGVGLIEREAKEKYGAIKVINFPMEANGKNVIEHMTDGRVKLIFAEENLTLVGASIIGKLATELIHELTLAVTHKLTYLDLKHTIHAHPTTSEVIWFALFKGMLADSTEKFMKMMNEKTS